MESTPSQRIDVDLLHLRDTREEIVRDVDDALVPGISDASGRIVSGSSFGLASPSGEVNASQRATSNAVTVLFENGRKHVEHARQVIAFLETVLARYGSVDELAKLDLDAVLRMFAEAGPAEPLTMRETRGRVA
jgi:hypothetical protein